MIRTLTTMRQEAHLWRCGRCGRAVALFTVPNQQNVSLGLVCPWGCGHGEAPPETDKPEEQQSVGQEIIDGLRFVVDSLALGFELTELCRLTRLNTGAKNLATQIYEAGVKHAREH